MLELERHPSTQRLEAINPITLPVPRGYSHGVLGSGQILCVSGQTGLNSAGKFPVGLAEQAKQALENIRAVLSAAGAQPEHVARLTWYVTDIQGYRSSLRELGISYRTVFGAHYPAMSLVEVSSLVEPGALVEIEATAMLPVRGGRGAQDDQREGDSCDKDGC